MKSSGVEVQQSMVCGAKLSPVGLHVPSMLRIQVGVHRADLCSSCALPASVPVPSALHVELCWRGDSKCGGSKQQFQESRIVFCVDVALSCSSRDAVGIRRWQDAAVSPLVSSLGFTMYKHFQRMRKLWTPFSCFLNMPLT